MSTAETTPPPEPAMPDESDGDRSSPDGWIDRLKAIIGLQKRASLRANLEDVLAEEAGDTDIFSPEERAMLRNILRLREVRVEDVMVPRVDIDAVEHNIAIGELLKVFRADGHSRMPVYRDTLDDPICMVLIKDLMAHITAAGTVKPEEDGKRRRKFPADLDLRQVDLSQPLAKLDLVRPLLFVPPSMLAADLLAKMQATRTQMALVIDEYGGTDGLASLEDVVETVVGDIEDEHDDVEGPMIVADSDDSYIADAKAPLEDVRALIGKDFDVGEHGEDVDTLGGLLFTLIGRVPVRGELIAAFSGFEFEVLDVDPRRIKRLRIRRRRPESEPQESRRRQRRSAPLPRDEMFAKDPAATESASADPSGT